jgi:hypothetical protein
LADIARATLAHGGESVSGSARDSLVQALRTHGLIGAEAPAPPDDALDRPWFIVLLQGVAGWLAGVFLLAFVGLILKPDDSTTILALGFLLLGAAWGIYVADRAAVFLDQFALALSIAGQIAMAWGILDSDPSPRVVAVTLLALQLTILVIMPNRIARTLAALFATIAWAYVVRLLLMPAYGDGLFFDSERSAARAPVFGAATPLAQWVFTWVPLLVLAIGLIRREPWWMARRLRELARPALTGLLLGLSLGGMIASPLAWFALGQPGTGLELSWHALFPLLSIGLAAFAAYGAFRLRSRGLLGFTILAALLHLSQFYYLYGTTLLWKSAIMACVGILLLSCGTWLQRRTKVAR